MRVRILSEWAGSPKCGTVAEVPDAMAAERIRSGWAEPEHPPLAGSSAPETAVAQPTTETRPAFAQKKRRS